MFHPPKIHSNHPSFIEVEENENVVEKFKEAMMSVHNILALDRLEQEVCLIKKLTQTGQLLNEVSQGSGHKTGSNPSENVSLEGKVKILGRSLLQSSVPAVPSSKCMSRRSIERSLTSSKSSKSLLGTAEERQMTTANHQPPCSVLCLIL